MFIILGLEAFTVHVQWEPEQNHDFGQAIEATYQLISTPISLNLKLILTDGYKSNHIVQEYTGVI